MSVSGPGDSSRKPRIAPKGAGQTGASQEAAKTAATGKTQGPQGAGAPENVKGVPTSQVLPGEGTPALPAPTAATPAEQAAAAKIIADQLKGTVALSAISVSQLKNMFEANGLELSDIQAEGLARWAAQKFESPEQLREGIYNALTQKDVVFDEKGNFKPEFLAEAKKMKEMGDQEVLQFANGKTETTQKQNAFFAIMLLLMQLQNQQWANLDQMAADQQVLLQGRFDMKKDTILDQAAMNFGMTIASSTVSLAGSVGAIAVGGNNQGTVMALNSISQTVGGYMNATKEFMSAGYEAQKVDTEKAMSQIQFGQEEAKQSRNATNQALEAYLQAAQQATQVSGEVRRGVSGRIA